MHRVLTAGAQRKKYVKKMFNDIAHRYDLLNHLLSGGADIYWRKRAIAELNLSQNDLVLDLACGTGDLAFQLAENKKGDVIGFDIAMNMLRHARQKAKGKKRCNKVLFLAGDGENLPFTAEKFSATTIAFGIRNMGSIHTCLSEMYRVLKQNGQLLILEFSLPRWRLFRMIYRLYFFKILPVIGKIISRDKEAYFYLPESVDQFPTTADFTGYIRASGFTKIQSSPVMNGVAVIYKAVKQNE